MLVLTRGKNQSIIINGNIRVTVVGVRNGRVRLGVEAPGDVPVYREEIFNAVSRQRQLKTEMEGRGRSWSENKARQE